MKSLENNVLALMHEKVREQYYLLGDYKEGEPLDDEPVEERPLIELDNNSWYIG